MQLRVLILLLVLAVPVAFFIGRQVGESIYAPGDAEEKEGAQQTVEERETSNPLTDTELEPAATPSEPQASSLTELSQGRRDVRERHEATGEDAFTPGTQNDPAELNEYEAAFRPDKDHQDARQAFNRAFSEHDQDYERQVQFTDFLLLHEQADKIDLHKILCATDKCQLIGQFDGDHKKWEGVMEEMKQQDWWDYTGTSSSSSTRDGVTYFNLFIDKEFERD